MSELRLTHCEICGGDGGFTEPVSMDPFSGRIREQVFVCEACGGTGEVEIELQEIEMEDLDGAGGDENMNQGSSQNASAVIGHPETEPALALIDELRRLGRAALKSDHENAMWFMRDAFHAADLLLEEDCATYRINAENSLKFMRRLFGDVQS